MNHHHRHATTCNHHEMCNHTCRCAANPGAVMRDCAKTCGVCATVCTDKETACPDWAAKGECEKNPASMLALCPQACGTCHELEKFASAKDEI